MRSKRIFSRNFGKFASRDAKKNIMWKEQNEFLYKMRQKIVLNQQFQLEFQRISNKKPLNQWKWWKWDKLKTVKFWKVSKWKFSYFQVIFLAVLCLLIECNLAQKTPSDAVNIDAEQRTQNEEPASDLEGAETWVSWRECP